MCRLFGIIARSPVSAKAHMLESDWSLLIQSMADPDRTQRDGWGLGYYDKGLSAAVKSPGFLAEEKDFADRMLSPVSGQILMGHIRQASNPRNLPKVELLGLEHTQPFFHDRHLFVHNGTLCIPDAVLENLGSHRSWVKGKNDSEALCGLLIKCLEEEDRHVLRAFKKALTLLKGIHGSLLESVRPPVAHHGLNIIYSDGDKLYGLCCYPKEEKARSLCSDRPYFQMTALAQEDSIILASEPLFPHSDWQDLSNGDLIECSMDPVFHINILGNLSHD